MPHHHTHRSNLHHRQCRPNLWLPTSRCFPVLCGKSCTCHTQHTQCVTTLNLQMPWFMVHGDPLPSAERLKSTRLRVPGSFGSRVDPKKTLTDFSEEMVTSPPPPLCPVSHLTPDLRASTHSLSSETSAAVAEQSWRPLPSLWTSQPSAKHGHRRHSQCCLLRQESPQPHLLVYTAHPAPAIPMRAMQPTSFAEMLSAARHETAQ